MHEPFDLSDYIKYIPPTLFSIEIRFSERAFITIQNFRDDLASILNSKKFLNAQHEPSIDERGENVTAYLLKKTLLSKPRIIIAESILSYNKRSENQILDALVSETRILYDPKIDPLLKKRLETYLDGLERLSTME